MADQILYYDKEALSLLGKQKLPLESQLALAPMKKEVLELFSQALAKITISNQEKIVEELREYVGLIFDMLMAQSKMKDSLLTTMMIGEYQKPSQTDVDKLKPQYENGFMFWGKSVEGDAILMLKLRKDTKWTPHTDAKWDKLLSLADRSMSYESGTYGRNSNGIGEMQFLLRYLGWSIVTPQPNQQTKPKGKNIWTILSKTLSLDWFK